MSSFNLYIIVHLLWIKEHYYHHQKIPLLVLENNQKYTYQSGYMLKTIFLDSTTTSLRLYCELVYIFQIGIELNFYKCFHSKYKNIKL